MRKFLWSVIAVIAVVAVGCSLTSSTNHDRSTRWSALPHTMGCTVEGSGTAQQPPSAIQIEQVTLRHDGGERLAISLAFVESVPPNPVAVTGPIGEPVPAIGSLIWAVNIKPHHVKSGFLSVSYAAGEGWSADVSAFDESNPDVLRSATKRGKTITFVLDLDGQVTFQGSREFKADVWVDTGIKRDALDIYMFSTQDCAWGTPVSPSPNPNHAPPTRSIPPSPAQSPRRVPPPASAPAPRSGTYRSVSGADAQGFTDSRGPRCNSTNLAVAIARTAQSRVVICQTGVGRLYYKGLGLQSGLPIEIDDPAPTPSGFVVTNEGVRYSLSRSALLITRGSEVISDEQMLEYWSR